MESQDFLYNNKMISDFFLTRRFDIETRKQIFDMKKQSLFKEIIMSADLFQSLKERKCSKDTK